MAKVLRRLLALNLLQLLSSENKFDLPYDRCVSRNAFSNSNFEVEPKETQVPPEPAQRAAKRTHDTPKTTPEGTKTSLEDPKTTPQDAKRSPKEPKRNPEDPKRTPKELQNQMISSAQRRQSRISVNIDNSEHE